MNKKKLVLQFFQKAQYLRMTEESYRKTVTGLFHWLLVSDDAAHDLTGKFLPDREIKGSIVSKQVAVIAGLEEVAFFLKQETGLEFEKKIEDGERVEKGQIVAVITGSDREVLSFERTVLNILQRMSGIATETQRLVDLIDTQNTFIAATRKTPWGLLDKKAVAAGGGLTHRLNLSDGILIKDNHLEIIKKSFGIKSEEEAVKKVLELILPQTKDSMIEIETNTQEGTQQAIQSFTSLENYNYLTIMLDNWKTEKAGEFIKKNNKEIDIYKIHF